MPRSRTSPMPRPFPAFGLVALVVALSTLTVEVVLFVAPNSGSDDPIDSDARRRHAADDHRLRTVRFEAGLAALGIGSALAGWAALTANRGAVADRCLAAASGMCCLASVAVWLALAASSCLTGHLKTMGAAAVVGASGGSWRRGSWLRWSRSEPRSPCRAVGTTPATRTSAPPPTAGGGP